MTRHIDAVGVSGLVAGSLLISWLPFTARHERPSGGRSKSLILQSDEPADHPPSDHPVRYRNAAVRAQLIVLRSSGTDN